MDVLIIVIIPALRIAHILKKVYIKPCIIKVIKTTVAPKEILMERMRLKIVLMEPRFEHMIVSRLLKKSFLAEQMF